MYIIISLTRTQENMTWRVDDRPDYPEILRSVEETYKVDCEAKTMWALYTRRLEIEKEKNCWKHTHLPCNKISLLMDIKRGKSGHSSIRRDGTYRTCQTLIPKLNVTFNAVMKEEKLMKFIIVVYFHSNLCVQ